MKMIVCWVYFEAVMSKKAKSVFALTRCWSAESLKVVLKVKMISTACFITYLWMNRPFERAVEWTVKDSLEDSLLRHLVAKQWKCSDWDLSRTRRWNINWKSNLSSQIRGSELTVLYINIYIFTIFPKVLAPPSNERFDYFSNFHEYKS